MYTKFYITTLRTIYLIDIMNLHFQMLFAIYNFRKVHVLIKAAGTNTINVLELKDMLKSFRLIYVLMSFVI